MKNKKNNTKKKIPVKKIFQKKESDLKRPKKILKNKKEPISFKKNSQMEEKAKVKKEFFPVHKTNVKIIGIGGGAGTILSEINSKVKKADFVLADTKEGKEKSPSKIKKFYFGEAQTSGFGTGMNPFLGELSAEGSKEKIESIFLGQDICIFISCMGGGAGSGALPVFSKIAKEKNVLTLGIFTLPFNFEGEKKKQLAIEAIEKAKPYLSSYLIIPNEKIFEVIDKQTPINSAFSFVNRKIADNLEGLIETLFLPGVINIDFADFRTILTGKGQKAFLNTVFLKRESIEEELEKIILDPFSSHLLIGARALIYNIQAGEDLLLEEVISISKMISRSASRNAKIIFGITKNKKNKGIIKVSVLAVGCGNKEDFLKEDKKKEEKTKDKKRKKKSSIQKNQIKIKKEKEKKEEAEKRRSGIQIYKESEKEKKDFLEEDPYETPAILRKMIRPM